MNILYTLNENYLPHLAASLCSLCENNKGAENITFHIISLGISNEGKQKISDLCNRYQRNFVFYEFGDMREKLKGEYDTGGFDTSVLSRLFVGSTVPRELDRILYLDCDTIIIDDISKYYNIDFCGKVIAAVPEPVITASRRGTLGMQPECDYYNAGVLLFNLDVWRNEDCEEKVINYFLENWKNLPGNDQDAINACFKNRIVTVPPKYNYGSYNLYYPYKLLKKLAGASSYVTKEEYDDSKANPAIIHYLGEERPWRIGNTHPYSNEYIKYLSMTPWHDFQLETGWKGYFFCFRIFNAVTRHLPALRYHIIDSLIPAFMRYRSRKLKNKTNGPKA